MTQNNPAGSIVVAIDGSTAALHAAHWATDEAVSRDIPLRLVTIVPPGAARTGADRDLTPEIARGREALRAADAAVHAEGKQVMVDTALHVGDVEASLVEESRRAVMICVGSVGIGWFASRLLGSTAVTLAKQAHCPVAIIRSDGEPITDDWIAVVVDDHHDNDDVVHHALEEARLRRAPLLALGVWRWDLGMMPYDELDQRLSIWLPNYPDVKVHLCATRGGAAEYLASNDVMIQLLVTGGVDADQLTNLIGPRGRSIGAHPRCSVLVVRH